MPLLALVASIPPKSEIFRPCRPYQQFRRRSLWSHRLRLKKWRSPSHIPTNTQWKRLSSMKRKSSNMSRKSSASQRFRRKRQPMPPYDNRYRISTINATTRLSSQLQRRM